MLINICNRTEVQKCTVFKIYKKILHSLKILHDYFYVVGVSTLQPIFEAFVNLNCFSVIFLADFCSLLLKVKEDITQ